MVVPVYRVVVDPLSAVGMAERTSSVSTMPVASEAVSSRQHPCLGVMARRNHPPAASGSNTALRPSAPCSMVTVAFW